MNQRERQSDGHKDSPGHDQLIEELSFINNHKDMNRWGDLIDCKHLEHKDEFYVEFLEVDFLLCRECVRRLYLVLRAMF